MANISTPNTFVPNTLIKSADVNANFSEIQTKYNAGAVQTDVAKTVTVAHTWNLGQVWGALQAFANGLTTTVVTITTAAAAAMAQRWTDATNYALEIGYASSLAHFWGASGTNAVVLGANAVEMLRLDWLNSRLSCSFPVQFTQAVSSIIPGATSLSLRNAANSADNLLLTDAGDATIRRDATITRNATVTGNLAVAGIVSGGMVAVPQTSDLTNTTTTPANTSLAVTLGTSQTWKIDFDLRVSCDNVGGIVLTFAGPAGVTGAQMLSGPTSGATTFTTSTFGGFTGTTWSTYNSASAPVYIRASCYVVTAGTGGAFTLQYAAGTAAQTAKVFTGSTLHATRIS